MQYIFKPQGFKRIYYILCSNGYNNSEFKNFRIGQIVQNITDNPSLFTYLLEVIRQIKPSNPLLVLKTQMLIQHLLQTDSSMQQNQQLLNFLREIQVRANTMVRAACPSRRLSTTDDCIQSTKNMANHSWQAQRSQCENGDTLLLLKIIQPLSQLQQKMIFSYDGVYRPSKHLEMDYHRCWATLNLLRKFLEIAPGIEEIGRYFYKEYGASMIYLIKVIDGDIQLLYKRVKIYVSQRVCELEVLTKEGRELNLEPAEHQRMEQMLLLVEQLQSVNEQIHQLYSGKYFVNQLVANDIYRPCLYKSQHKLDIFYQLKKTLARRIARRYPSPLKKRDSMGLEVVDDV